jgi:hypothetical protein
LRGRWDDLISFFWQRYHRSVVYFGWLLSFIFIIKKIVLLLCTICAWLGRYIYNFCKSPFHYSGLEFILSKFIPLEKSDSSKPLPTGPIWLLGIYVAFWTLASERYEYKVDIIEARVNSIYAELGASDLRKYALGRIPEIQRMTCPEKPDILSPLSIFRSIFF